MCHSHVVLMFTVRIAFDHSPQIKIDRRTGKMTTGSANADLPNFDPKNGHLINFRQWLLPFKSFMQEHTRSNHLNQSHCSTCPEHVTTRMLVFNDVPFVAVRCFLAWRLLVDVAWSCLYRCDFWTELQRSSCFWLHMSAFTILNDCTTLYASSSLYRMRASEVLQCITK